MCNEITTDSTIERMLFLPKLIAKKFAKLMMVPGSSEFNLLQYLPRLAKRFSEVCMIAILIYRSKIRINLFKCMSLLASFPMLDNLQLSARGWEEVTDIFADHEDDEKNLFSFKSLTIFDLQNQNDKVDHNFLKSRHIGHMFPKLETFSFTYTPKCSICGITNINDTDDDDEMTLRGCAFRAAEPWLKVCTKEVQITLLPNKMSFTFTKKDLRELE